MTWVGTAVAVGTTIYGAQQAKKLAKGSKTQRSMEQLMLDNARQTAPIGMDMLKKGNANMGVFNDFYKKLATGDRSAAMKMLAPQLRQADQQSAAAMGSNLTLNPRGGGSAEGRMAGMDMLKGGREDAFVNLRTSAVDTLGAMGGEMASMGSGLLGQSSNGGLGLLGAIQNRRNSAFDQGRAMGAGSFEMWKYIQNRIPQRTPATPAPTTFGTLPKPTNTFSNAMQFSPGVKP